MSKDVVVITQERPELPVAFEGLPSIRLATTPDAIHLLDTEGHLLVAASHPVRVMVAGEIERLLGTPVAPPVWWVDLRAAADLPRAAQLARECADVLTTLHGGMVWTAQS